MQRIHTLWLWGFATLVSLTGACVMNGPDDAAFTARWTVRRADGVPIPCSDVLAQRVWFELRPLTGNTSQKQDVYATCAQGALTSPVLPIAQYMVTVHILGPNDAELTATPLAFDQPVPITGGGLTTLPDIDFVMDTAPPGTGPRMGLTWSFSYVGAPDNAPALDCASAGAATVEVSVAAAGAAPMVVPFACADGSGITPIVTPGIYSVQVTAKDASGHVISGNAPELIPIFPIGTDYGHAAFAVQSFVASWAITKAGVATTCAAVGAATVQLDAQKAPTATDPTPAPLTYQFPCAAMTGATQAVDVGTYAVTLSLLDAAGKPIGAPQSMAGFVASANARAVLPTLTFALP
jgi:hypothetical protein